MVDNVPSQRTSTIYEQQIGKLPRFVIDDGLCHRPNSLPLLDGFSNCAVDRFSVWAACLFGWNFEKTYTLFFRPALLGRIPPNAPNSQTTYFVASQSRKQPDKRKRPKQFQRVPLGVLTLGLRHILIGQIQPCP